VILLALCRREANPAGDYPMSRPAHNAAPRTAAVKTRLGGGHRRRRRNAVLTAASAARTSIRSGSATHPDQAHHVRVVAESTAPANRGVTAPLLSACQMVGSPIKTSQFPGLHIPEVVVPDAGITDITRIAVTALSGRRTTARTARIARCIWSSSNAKVLATGDIMRENTSGTAKS
jgi:hypothetical protein